MQVILVTVDSLRYDAFQENMPLTRDTLEWNHDLAFSTGPNTGEAFPAILGGVYPRQIGLPTGTSLALQMGGYTAGVSTNHLLATKYGYNEGFDTFSSPADEGDSLKDWATTHLSQGTFLYKIGAKAWSLFERVSPHGYTPSFRPAADVIADFETIRAEQDDWFIWLHFMEPHHPYEPPTAEDRLYARQLSRSVIAGSSSDPNVYRQVRSYYRQEVEALDRALESLWEQVSDDTRVLFCADHGELLGEDGKWGHPGCFKPELLHVPLGGINIQEPGNLVSLVDVPSLLLGSEHNQGELVREVAFATDGREWAATDGEEIATPEGVFDLWDGSKTENPRLKRAQSSFDAKTSALEEADTDDLEQLGYL